MTSTNWSALPCWLSTTRCCGSSPLGISCDQALQDWLAIALREISVPAPFQAVAATALEQDPPQNRNEVFTSPPSWLKLVPGVVS